MSVHFSGRVGWSDVETATLRTSYKRIPRAQLEALLPGRRWSAIREQARRLGLAQKHVYKRKFHRRLPSRESILARLFLAIDECLGVA